MKLINTLAAVTAVTITAANGATILYSQDFQGIAIGTTNPDGWNGATRAFSGTSTTSVEDGAEDRALIATGVGNYTTRKELTIAIEPNTTYTLSLKGGVYASSAGRSGTFRYSLGTGTVGSYTQLSTESVATLNQTVQNEYFFGAGNNASLPDLVYTSGATVSGANLVIHVRAEGDDYQGVDNIVLTAVPEPSSAALLGLGGLALILRRRK